MIIGCYKIFFAADRTFIELGNRVIRLGVREDMLGTEELWQLAIASFVGSFAGTAAVRLAAARVPFSAFLCLGASAVWLGLV
jgi:hypothetical protein